MTAPTEPLPQPIIEEDLALLKTRIKNEAHLTSNLGYGNAKKRELEVFNNIVWPRLAALGWVQVEGTGDKLGSVFFLPSKDVEIKYGRRGKDYYNRIKDVIERILQRRNDTETEIADAYQEEIDALQNGDDYEAAPTPERTSKRLRPQRNATRLDLSWKEGGIAFPRTTSRVGNEYQAVDLPSSDTFEKEQARAVSDSDAGEEEPKALHDQVWSPQQAEESGVLDHVSDHVKFNLKEPAMVAFHECGYDKAKLSDSISTFELQDGSDWTDEEKARFRIEIFRQRKDLSAVAKSMNKSVNSCMTYYLSRFKKSDDYRLLKTLRAEERAEKLISSVQGLDACGVCGDGGNLLICDECEGEFHMTCMKPSLAEIPEGHWECDDCVNRKFLRARDKLIRNTRIYERAPAEDSSRKRKAGDMDPDRSGSDEKNAASDDGESLPIGNGHKGQVVLRPTPHVLAAVKKLALSISQALDVSNESVPNQKTTGEEESLAATTTT